MCSYNKKNIQNTVCSDLQKDEMKNVLSLERVTGLDKCLLNSKKGLLGLEGWEVKNAAANGDQIES